MTETLKSRLSAIFLPKLTHTFAGTSPRMAEPNQHQSQRHSQHRRASTHSACHRFPITLTARHEPQQRRQTLESENAHDELVKHGIKVRDFQVEADRKKYSGSNVQDDMTQKRADRKTFERTMEVVDKEAVKK